jgi:hypothetical protein
MLGLQLLLCIYETWFFTEDYSIVFFYKRNFIKVMV